MHSHVMTILKLFIIIIVIAMILVIDSIFIKKIHEIQLIRSHKTGNKKRKTGMWGPILNHFEQLVGQIRRPGQADAMAGILDTRNTKFDLKSPGPR